MWLCAAALGAAPAFAASTPDAAPLQVQQAPQTCKGTVVDEEGEPLIGATVKVKGTTIGAATNFDGEFSLANVKPGSTIEVNYIGYTPTTVQWNGGPLSIVLKSNSTVLDDVVVMGYGVTQKRAKVTNSIAKVSEDVLSIGANANPAQALAGAVSGVKVNITTGDPGATPEIVVRGGTDFSGAGSPLIVVDGQIRSSLSDINPNDIADMQVLKDAGATALYGARAANGVVLITTKQGTKGSAKVTFNGKFGMSWYDSGYDWVDAGEYIYWSRKGTWDTEWAHTRNGIASLSANNQPAGIGRTAITSDMVWNIMTKTADNAYLLEKGWSEMADPITDATILYRSTTPASININNPAYVQDYNLSFSGGNDRGNYYASLGYYDADGAFIHTYYKRYNFAFTGGYKINNWLESNSAFTFTRANWENLPCGGSGDDRAGFIFGRVMSVPPTLRLTDEDGKAVLGQNTDNTNYNYQPGAWVRNNQSDKFQMTQSLTAKPFDGMTVKGTMSWYYNEQLTLSQNKDIQTSPAAIPGAAAGWNRTYSQGASFLRYFDQTYNIVANYNKTFAEKHTINVMAGWEFYRRNYKAFSASGSNLPTGEWFNLGATFAGQQSPYKASTRSISSSLAEEKILSWFGRAEYDYMDKYLLAVTFRSDGYSRLINNRWGTFPGVSAGWVVSQEDFFKESAVAGWWNYAKVRGSFGLNGLVNGNYIGYYTLQGSFGAYNYDGNYGYRISSLPNQNLKWERTRTGEVGVDFGFLSNRINLGLTYYNRLTMDKYANYSLPKTTGFSSVVNNNGKLRNQGVEIDLNGTILNTNGIRWTLGANLTYNKNIIVELPENEFKNNAQGATYVWANKWQDNPNNDENITKRNNEKILIGGYQEGQEPGHVIGYRTDHMVRSEGDFPKGYVDISGGYCAVYADDEGYQKLVEMGKAAGAMKLMPGDIVWKDRNGDGIIDQYDRYDLGNLLPHWTGGFNTTVSWKGLQLYARFDMGFDATVYDSNLAWYLGCGQGTYSFPTQIRDTWTPENPNAKYPRYVWASVFGTDAHIRTSDVYAQSGAYLACRELSLSYQLPANICKKFSCQGLTLSVTGQNLGYFKKTTLPLPDKVSYVTGNTGGNGGTYNVPRQLIFGLNVSF